MPIEFVSVASHVPPKVVTNDELSTMLDTNDEWIYSHTGIKKRHITADDEHVSDLAYNAAKKAIAKAGILPEEIDLIIVATSTADYLSFPSVACMLQFKLSAVNAGAFDLSAACTGFIYAVETARCLLEGGRYKTILVVGGDTLSKVADWTDRGTCVLFGDGAGAAILRASADPDRTGIRDAILGADGSGYKSLYRPAEPTFTHFGCEPALSRDVSLKMNGREVYNFAVRVNIEIIDQLLTRNKLTIDDIDFIVPHQANLRIIEAASSRSKIPMEKFFVNMQEYANTSAASIPIALTEMEEKGILKKGMRLILTGFGAGLTYGGVLLDW